MGPDGAAALASGLSRNRTLRGLSLDANDIQSYGSLEIAHAAIDHPALTALDMRNNGISEQGVWKLRDLLNGHPTLKVLDLDGNGDAAAISSG